MPVVFLSYSHKDVIWLDKVRVHLKSLKQDHEILTWDDSRIEPGDVWRERIENAIEQASIAILLVSADFLASDFIRDVELPLLLERSRTQGLRIISLLISPSRFWGDVQLANLQAVNTVSTTLTGLSEHAQNEVLVKLAEAVDQHLRSRSEEPVEEMYTASVAFPLPSLYEPPPAHVWDTESELEDLKRRLRAGEVLTDSDFERALESVLQNTNEWSRSISHDLGQSTKRAAADFFPRARTIPLVGIFFVGCAQVWCWIRDAFEWFLPRLDPETIRQIVILFTLLFAGIYPVVLVSDARDPNKRSYSYWLVFGVITFGLLALASGGVLAAKYGRALVDRSAAAQIVKRVASEHPKGAQSLEAAWHKLPDENKRDAQRLMISTTVKPWVYSELGDELTVFAEAKAIQYRTEDAWDWLLLCLLAIVVGLIDVVCGIKLASLKKQYY